MSNVKRYLDTRKTAYAHDVARICAALSMNGWAELAMAIEADFAAPTLAQEFAEMFNGGIDPTQGELFEVCDHIATSLDETQQRELAARLLCRANGLDPDEKTDGEKGSESQAETLAAFQREKVDADEPSM